MQDESGHGHGIAVGLALTFACIAVAIGSVCLISALTGRPWVALIAPTAIALAAALALYVVHRTV